MCEVEESAGNLIFDVEVISLQEKIHDNYQQIQFRPDQFHAYLLSPEVGFTEHKFLGVPSNKNEGEQ